MNQTRTGKIARLPRPIRDELNRRLENGEEAKPLAAWLNSLPEVDRQRIALHLSTQQPDNSKT